MVAWRVMEGRDLIRIGLWKRRPEVVTFGLSSQGYVGGTEMQRVVSKHLASN